jgi:helicase MOV-10
MSALATLVHFIRVKYHGGLEAHNFGKFAEEHPAAAKAIGKLKKFVTNHPNALQWVGGKKPLVKVRQGSNIANTPAMAPATKKQALTDAIATTATLFYDSIRANSDLRERCEDRGQFNVSFREWKYQRSLQGDALRGGASAVLHFMKKKVWVKGVQQGGVLVYKGISQGTWKSQTSDAAERVRTQRTQFESDKHGITISDATFTEVLPMRVKSEKHITITNATASNQIWLLSVEQVTQRHQFSCSLAKAFDPIRLKPSDNRLSLICEPASAGMLRTIFVFSFRITNTKKSSKQFAIARYVEARCGNQVHLDLLRPTAPYKKKVRKPRPSRFSEQVIDEGSGASQPSGWVNQLGFYNPPGSWTSMILHEEAADWLEEEQKKLSPSNYILYFHRLLWCEERQQKNDILFFSMEGVTLTKEREYLKLHVPGLAENRPSVLCGDRVKIRSDMPGKAFIGYAQWIHLEDVVLKLPRSFHSSYITGQRVSVEFQLSRTPMRIFHQGAEMSRYLDSSVLFPTLQSKLRPPDGLYPCLLKFSLGTPALTIGTALASIPGFRELNQLQQQAVTATIEGRSRPAPYIIFGPPGTGKTRTMVVAAFCFFKLQPKATLLLCAPSNSAADLLVERLSEHGVNPNEMLRVMAYSRSPNTVTDKVRPFVNLDEQGGHFVFPSSLESFGQYRIVVATAVMAGKLWNNGVKRGHFDAIFIDEAGHALEPEAVAPLATLLDGEARIVLAGDPKQLGPIIVSDPAKKFGLECSLLQRLIERPVYHRDGGGDQKYNPVFITKLEENYRSHPCILELPNKLFYDGDLKVAADPRTTHNLEDWEHLPQQMVPLIFHGVEGQDRREENSPSWFNADEASEVVRYVKLLLQDTKKNKVQPHEIGIISPVSTGYPF